MATLPPPPAKQQAHRPLPALPPSFHHFIVSRTSNKLNFISLHFISDRFTVSQRFISWQRICVK
jgi:hypothetical protein